MSVTNDFTSARDTRVRLAAATQACDEWRVLNTLADENDTSNTEGQGYTDRDGGLGDLEVEINSWHSVGANPLAVYAAGNVILNNRLWTNAAMTLGWNLPVALVVSCEETARVKEMVRLRITIKNKGPFSFGA